MQLIAGINIAPSFVKNFTRIYAARLEISLNNILFKKINKKINNLINDEKISLSDKKSDILKRLTEIKEKIDKIYFIDETLFGLTTYRQDYLILERKVSTIEKKMESSLILSGFFSIGYLIFIPLSDAFLNNTENDIHYRVYYPRLLRPFLVGL